MTTVLPRRSPLIVEDALNTEEEAHSEVMFYASASLTARGSPWLNTRNHSRYKSACENCGIEYSATGIPGWMFSSAIPSLRNRFYPQSLTFLSPGGMLVDKNRNFPNHMQFEVKLPPPGEPLNGSNEIQHEPPGCAIRFVTFESNTVTYDGAFRILNHFLCNNFSV